MEYLLVLQNIRQLLGNIGEIVMLWITSLGEPAITFLFFSAIYWCVNKRAGQFMGFNIAIGCATGQCLKEMYKIKRPWEIDTRIKPSDKAISTAVGYSFPSGHTLRAMSCYGAFSYWFKKRKSQLWYIGYVIVLLVAFSRIYLGVHTLIDIVGAIVLSSIFYIILFDLMEWSRKYLGRKLLLALLLIVILGILVGVFGPLSNIGTGFGIVSGYIMEVLFVKFKPKGSIGIRIIRFFIGACGLLFIMNCLGGFGAFVNNFIVGFYIIYLYPAIFSKLNL